ncbi:MAG: helix-turn-helix domain-containing protein [Actinomycetota bacterium]|nr:helix-turn-helix domain-containing protein [Actinomycetota bacterium]
MFRVAYATSREALAKSAGVHRETVARLERSEHVPSDSTARALARALGVSAADLFPNDDDRAPTRSLVHTTPAMQEPQRDAG